MSPDANLEDYGNLIGQRNRKLYTIFSVENSERITVFARQGSGPIVAFYESNRSRDMAEVFGYDPKRTFTSHIYVQKAHRQEGIAGAMFAALSRKLQEKGLIHIININKAGTQPNGALLLRYFLQNDYLPKEMCGLPPTRKLLVKDYGLTRSQSEFRT